MLTLSNICKSYPGVMANDAITLTINAGEIHALLGENGAGKSTLVKTIYGLVKPDTGTMTLDGKPFHPAQPRAARAQGIAMVFQHFSLFEALTVAENIALGMETPPKPAILSQTIVETSAKYGLSLEPSRLIGDLSVGERQRVEIVRCLIQNPKLLIMDEPTSVLTPQEVARLFKTLRQLQSEGTAILYISHKLEEIKTLCDRATILRAGRVIGTADPRRESAKSMAEAMVGAKLSAPLRHTVKTGETLLKLNDLSLESADPFGTSLRGINLNLSAGQIIGIGGVAGNGQDEFMLAVSGEDATEPHAITFKGAHIGTLNPTARRMAGIFSAPEERSNHAGVANMTLAENTMLTAFYSQNLGTRGFIKYDHVHGLTHKIIDTFDVRTSGIFALAKSLSGGNLQKFVIGREILQNPAVFIVNQPTWGVDPAAANAIRRALIQLAEDGAGVIVISQDLDELLEISDTLGVLNNGYLSELRPTQTLGMDEIGLMMGGAGQ